MTLPSPSQFDGLRVPHDIEIEQQLLGALMYSNEIIGRVVDLVTPAAFYSHLHGRIYEAIVGRWKDDKMANPVTLQYQFVGDENLDEVGGAGYLVELTERAVTPNRAEEFAAIIADLAARRYLQSVAADIMVHAGTNDISETADRQVDTAAAALRETMELIPSKADATTMDAAADGLLKAQEDVLKGTAPPTIGTGLDTLDGLIGGFRPGQMIVVGARPGMGKTALLLHLAHAACQQGFGVSFASLEMTATELMERIIAMMASKPYSYIHFERIANASVHSGNDERVADAFRRARQLPLVINDRSPMTIQRIESGARVAHNIMQKASGHSLGIVFVDYLQLIKPAQHRRDLYEQMTEVSNDIKAMAKRLGCAVVVAAQLSREVEKRTNKRPIGADLRQTGAIEQDADKILFPYRPARYDDDASEMACEVIVEKNRQGRTGTVHVMYEQGSNLFFDRGGEELFK